MSMCVKLLELKRLLEDYVVSGVHLELSLNAADSTSAVGRPWRTQNDILRSVGDVSVKVGEVHAYVGSQGAPRQNLRPTGHD